MKKPISLRVALALCLVASGAAHALPFEGPDPIVTFEVTVDGDTRPVGLTIAEDRRGFALPAPVQLIFGDNRVTLSDVSGQFDPVLNLGAAALDGGPPSSFSFGLGSALVPNLVGVVSYTIDLVGGFTDGASDGGSIAPSGAQSFGVMDAGLDFNPIDGVGGNAAFPNPPNAHNYGPFNKVGVFDCGVAPGCQDFDIAFGFTGSGGGDTYTLNGRFEVVPEPGTAFLLGLGLTGLAVAGRSRR